MPRKKRESLLQRQRRKLKTEQAMKASKKQLPSKGGSSGGSIKARAQRGMTRDKMAKQQLTNFARALKKTLKQSSAQSKLNIAAKGTKGTGVRTAGAGGGLAKRPSSALARANARKGGPLTKATSGGPTSKGRGGALVKRGSLPVKSDFQQVKVKDLGTTKGGSTRTGQPAANRSRLPARAGGALVKSSNGALRAVGMGAGKLLGRISAGLTIAENAKLASEQRNRMRAAGKQGRATLHTLASSMSGGAASPVPQMYQAAKKLKDSLRGSKMNREPAIKPGEKYGPSAPKNKGTIGGLIKPTSKPKASESTNSNSSATKSAASQSTPAKTQPTKPKADHGKHTDTINRLMKRYQELRKLKMFKEADSLGKRIHAMKYEKSGSGIRIRR